MTNFFQKMQKHQFKPFWVHFVHFWTKEFSSKFCSYQFFLILTNHCVKLKKKTNEQSNNGFKQTHGQTSMNLLGPFGWSQWSKKLLMKQIKEKNNKFHISIAGCG